MAVKYKFLIILVVTALMGISISAWSQESVKYKIGTAPWTAWSPAYVADELGFWRELGLDISLITFKDCTESTDALKDGLIDLGFEMLGTAVGLYLEGMDIGILVETNWSHGGDKIIVQKGVDLTKLKGSPIGLYSISPPLTYFLDLYLREHGLSTKDFRLVELDPEAMHQLFVAGRLTAVVIYEPEATNAMNEGDGMVGASTATYHGCMPEGIIGRKERLAQIPKEDLAKILRGWIKAVEWCKQESNIQRYLAIINKQEYRRDAQYSVSRLREILQISRIHDVDALIESNRDGGGTLRFLGDLKTFIENKGELTRDFQPEELFDNSAIMEILQERQR